MTGDPSSVVVLEPHNDDCVLFSAFNAMRHEAHVVTVLRSSVQGKRFGITAKEREDETHWAMRALALTHEQWAFPDEWLLPRPHKRQFRRSARYLAKTPADVCGICGINRAEAEVLGRVFEEHHRVDHARLLAIGEDPNAPWNLDWCCDEPCHATVTELRRRVDEELAALRTS